MMGELVDLTRLVEKAEDYKHGYGKPQPPDEEEVARCIQALLQRQCIYPHQRRYSRVHEILSTEEYQGFFRKYFAAMGLEFYWDHRSRMVALRVPRMDKKRFEYQPARLSKEETIVLLALKLAYEEGFQKNEMGTRGEVEITTDDLVDKIDAVAGVGIEEKTLREALTRFKGKGVCELGELDRQERVQPVTILPGVEVAWPEYYSELVANWAEEHRLAEEATARGADEADGTDDTGSEGEGLPQEVDGEPEDEANGFDQADRLVDDDGQGED